MDIVLYPVSFHIVWRMEGRKPHLPGLLYGIDESRILLRLLVVTSLHSERPSAPEPCSG
jgi:hypothetical protein